MAKNQGKTASQNRAKDKAVEEIDRDRHSCLLALIKNLIVRSEEEKALAFKLITNGLSEDKLPRQEYRAYQNVRISGLVEESRYSAAVIIAMKMMDEELMIRKKVLSFLDNPATINRQEQIRLEGIAREAKDAASEYQMQITYICEVMKADKAQQEKRIAAYISPQPRK